MCRYRTKIFAVLESVEIRCLETRDSAINPKAIDKNIFRSHVATRSNVDAPADRNLHDRGSFADPLFGAGRFDQVGPDGELLAKCESARMAAHAKEREDGDA